MHKQMLKSASLVFVSSCLVLLLTSCKKSLSSPVPAPHTQALCYISFDAEQSHPARVNSEAKACLDEVAADLQKQPGARIVLVGNATTAEKTLPEHHRRYAKLKNIAARRAINAMKYLVKVEDIASSRISIATGSANNKQVDNYLVPKGAIFAHDVPGTTPVNQSTMEPQKNTAAQKKPHNSSAA